MKHPTSRDERLDLRKRYSGKVLAQRWLQYKYAGRNRLNLVWVDSFNRSRALTRDARKDQ